MNRYITFNKDKIVTSIRWGNEIIEGEIQSDAGELGQKLNEDGSFKDLPKEDIQNENKGPSLEDKINFIYYKLQGVV